jgi:uncharacterized protein YecE (DUF72 family)
MHKVPSLALEYRIGCSGWSYSAWEGPFYPNKLPSAKCLEYYSRVFDYVEVDSTFYATPPLFNVKRWVNNTPANFRFTVTMPKRITHDKAFADSDIELQYFYSSLLPLKDKNLAFLIQMPPYLSFKTGFKLLKNFCNILDSRYRYAVEVRQTSWFNDEFYDLLKDREICLVWNQLDAVKTPPIVTTDFVYVRLIGDRSINEKDFGKIQKDRETEMQNWTEQVKAANVSLAIVSANNHYAGFGPGTSNVFRRMIGLDEKVWDDKEQSHLPF